MNNDDDFATWLPLVPKEKEREQKVMYLTMILQLGRGPPGQVQVY